MKKFCVLSQGSKIKDSITESHIKNFKNKKECDFYKLNWKTEKDPYSDFYFKNVWWSEGRSLLYDCVPKNYEYYIFIDDDIVFENENVRNLIYEKLNEYNPLTGTFYQKGTWLLNSYEQHKKIKDTFPIYGFDLCVFILHKSVLENLFPIPYHGSGRTMWYIQYIISELYPGKQLCFSDIIVRNDRHEIHEDINDNKHDLKVVENFLKNLKGHRKNISLTPKKIAEKNKNIDISIVNTEKISFSTKKFSKIYNVNNPEWKERNKIRK